MIDAFGQDFRIAARRLARHRAFTITALVTLALGIGVNSAIFSVVDAVLLRALPFDKQHELVEITEQRNGAGDYGISAHEYMAWREATSVLSGALMYRNTSFTLTGRGDATTTNALLVTANFFDVLGTHAILGRGFADGEDVAGANRVAVLSHKYWMSRFGADSGVVGTDIALDNTAYRVLGVMAPGGEFDPEMWVPFNLRAEAQTVGRHATAVIARLKPTVTLEQAQREVSAVSARLERELPQANAKHGALLTPVYDSVVGNSKRAVLVVFGAVGFVLLIACANVAHLLLTRAAGRRREVAICAAVGASRGRIIAQLLSESVLLAVLGGGLGILVAVWIVGLLPSIPAIQIPRIAEARIDTTVVAVTLGLSLLTGLLSGIVPAFRASNVSLTEWLSAGARSSDRGGRRIADGLVVSEIALAFALLVGAGLMVRSFTRLTSVRPGFNADNVLVVSTSVPASSYSTPASQRDAFDAIARRIGALDGVAAVGTTTAVPIAMCCNGMYVTMEGMPEPQPGEDRSALTRTVGGDYFAAMGVPLTQGRLFDASDARKALPLMRWYPQQPYPAFYNEPQAAPVAVINEAMARRYWPDGNALGRRFKAIESPWITVIGVVGDVRDRGLGGEISPEYYLSASQEPAAAMTFVIRTAGDPVAIDRAVRAEIRGFDKTLPVSEATTMRRVVSNSVGRPRFNALALASFAVLALALSLVGIYGVLSHAVAQRTREIGIRCALGANAVDVMKLVLGRAAALTGIGIAVGLVAAYSLSGLLTRLLFEIQPTDAPTYVMIAALLGVSSLLASYLPARRALAIDAVGAMKEE
ncbi:MAG TPA: ABC transporter permease [Gemmatimonadaceae bacterium]|nr:ABC transporter permease [Gemmatimonadaceae bacterium]